MEFLCLTWDDVDRLLDELAQKIQENGFHPEVLVAIGRGGFVPARILCDLLGVRELASIGIRYYEDIGRREKQPRILHPVNADVTGREVLVVDDVSDSGQSLQMALSEMLEQGAREVRIATVHYKPRSLLKPDFFAEKTESWIIYPWEILESARSLIAEMRRQGLGKKEMEDRLSSLGFKEKRVSFLLEDV